MERFGTFLGLDLLIERSVRRQRTVTIYVRKAHILVRAPEHTPVDTIHGLLARRSAWIQKQIIKLQTEETSPHWPRNSILLQGRVHTLAYRQTSGLRYSFRQQEDLLEITGPAESLDHPEIKVELVAWLTNLAKIEINQCVLTQASRLGSMFRTVRIKNLKSRWGSCSSQGNLNFNWRLILAPPWVLNYVVVHELCHLHEMNHSSRFWARVQEAMPDYPQAKRWLKEHGSELYF